MELPVTLKVQKDIQIRGKRIGDYFYDENSDTIYYDLPYHNFPCKFAVAGLQAIFATPAMMKLPGFLKYHNMDWLKQQLSQIQLVLQDRVLLHGSAWRKNDRIYLAAGFANSGKTTSIIKETQAGAAWIADENVIVNKDMWLEPVQRRTSLSWHLSKYFNLSFSQRLDFVWKRFRAKLLPIYEPNVWIDIPVGLAGTLTDLIYLTPGKKQSLALLTDNEFPFYTNPVIQTFSYASGFDLDSVYKKYRGLLNEIERLNTKS